MIGNKREATKGVFRRCHKSHSKISFSMTFKVGFSKIGPSTFDTLDLTEFLSQSFSGPWLAKWHYNSVGRLQLSKVLFSYLLHSIASLRRSMNVTLLQCVAQFILSIKKFLERGSVFTDHAVEGLLLPSLMKTSNFWSKHSQTYHKKSIYWTTLGIRTNKQNLTYYISPVISF